MKNLLQRSILFTVLGSAAFAASVDSGHPQPASCSEMETFLRNAEPGKLKALSVGVTGTQRITLSAGSVQHDAHVQTVDERKDRFVGSAGQVEINFRDSYKYNIAAYELAKLLDLNMVPPYVERNVIGAPGSLSWWVNDSMMEAERYKKNIRIPDPARWNEQMYAVRVFHELVYDTDPNLTNLLITRNWQLWIIDLTRAFRTYDRVREPKNLVKCDRHLLAKMRDADAGAWKQALGRWLTAGELRGLDARRKKIVKFFDGEVKSKGEDAVLYDFPRTAQACGTGL